MSKADFFRDKDVQEFIHQDAERVHMPNSNWVSIGRVAVEYIGNKSIKFKNVFGDEFVPRSLIAVDQSNNYLIKKWKYDQLVNKLIA